MSAPARTRAPAMAPEERRAAIVAAAVPLFLDGGPAITTRQVAEAAGIAEGTLFRAFADKEDLVEAVIAAALDPTAADEAMTAIDVDRPFEERLVAAVDVLRERVTTYIRVMALAGATRSGPVSQPQPPASLPHLEALIADGAHRLRLEPTEAAHVLRGLIVVNVHPSFHPGPPRSSAEIVDLFLHGAAAPTTT